MKELNIELQNDIRGLLHLAFPLCILNCDKIYRSLVMQSYIKCVATSFPGFTYVDGFSYISETTKSGPLEINKLAYSLHFVMNNTEKTILESIESNYYVVVFSDEFYMQGRAAFGEHHFYHEVMVYGYDDDHFYFIGFDENKTFKKMKTSRKSLALACVNGEKIAWEGAVPIILLKPKNLYCEHIFSYDDFKHSLNEYRKSKIDYEFLALNYLRDDKIYWGINCNDLIKDLILNNIKLDMAAYPAIHSWCEYKSHLLKKFNDAKELWDIGIKKTFIDQYQDIVNRTNIIRLLLIKKCYRTSRNIDKKLLNQINEVIELENLLLSIF